MPRRTSATCLPLVLTLGLVMSVGATAVPAAATTNETGVTVYLKAPNLRALRELAATHGLSHAQRMARLRKLLPTPAQHRSAEAALRRAGLTVTDETAWSVTATGPDAGVRGAFGSHPQTRARASAAQRRAANGPYPSMPASLRGVATAAYPTAGSPRMFHHNVSGGLLIGSDFRNANASPARTATGQAPYSGSDPAATLTIATLQFAGWNAGDLTTWANTSDIGVPGFNAATGLTTVPIGPLTSLPAPDPKDDGDIEVDLDQEALLSTDPYAHQRAYFANNDADGYLNAVAQVLDDVTGDSFAYQGGDRHIVALSTSWGLCEFDSGSTFINDLEPILAGLQAAGVTIFASSGDDGIYDGCSASGANVDYPASSPEVVAVGGTKLAPVGSSAPNDGSNWTETAWSCSSVSDCGDLNTGGGSGGGVSAGFSRPDYQGVVSGGTFGSTTMRMVPDIAADADTDTGFPGYSSDPSDGAGYYVFGGTSLAAPVSAALFTNALAAHAVTSGVGEIHSALYSAYAGSDSSFRDVTSGTNGAAADAGSDPSASAAIGYDTVTGLGAPMWADIVDRVLNPLVAPKATASLSFAHLHSSSPYQISARWTGTAATGGLAVDNATVRITRAGHSGSVYSAQNAPASGSHSFTAQPGSTYTLSVTARDLAGTTSSTRTTKIVVPIDDKDFSVFGGWKDRKSAGSVGGSITQTAHRGASAIARGKGKTYSLAVRTGPSYGKLVVTEAGRKLKTIDLYAWHAATKRVTLLQAASATSRTFDFVCIGKKSKASSSTAVDVDAMYVAY